MALKIPPLVLIVLIGASMWLIDDLLVNLQLARFPGQDNVAYAIACVGLFIDFFALRLFLLAGTTANPMRPTEATTFVCTGLYKLTRNPMYLGHLIILIAWAVWLGNPSSIVCLVCYVAYMNHFQIQHEEAALESQFGEIYVQYKQRVRRWI